MTRTRESSAAQDRRALIGIFFVSACLYLHAIHLAYGQWQLNRTGIIASGEVTAITGGRNGRYPIVRFTAPNGETHTFRERHSSAFSPMHEGDHVEVIYPPGLPQDARITETQWLGVWVFIVIASIIGGIGLLALVASRLEPDSHP